MNDNKRSKAELLKVIERLEKNPRDRITFLTDVGAIGVGVAGAGAAAFAFGGTTASILFGLVAIPVAAPVAVVAGAAILGGGAVLGVKRVFIDGTRQSGKADAMRKHLEDLLQEAEERERRDGISDQDKTQFYSFLKEPLRLNLISAEDAQQLMELVETGKMTISGAYEAVGAVISVSAATEH